MSLNAFVANLYGGALASGNTASFIAVVQGALQGATALQEQATQEDLTPLREGLEALYGERGSDFFVQLSEGHTGIGGVSPLPTDVAQAPIIDLQKVADLLRISQHQRFDFFKTPAEKLDEIRKTLVRPKSEALRVILHQLDSLPENDLPKEAKRSLTQTLEKIAQRKTTTQTLFDGLALMASLDPLALADFIPTLDIWTKSKQSQMRYYPEVAVAALCRWPDLLLSLAECNQEGWLEPKNIEILAYLAKSSPEKTEQFLNNVTTKWNPTDIFYLFSQLTEVDEIPKEAHATAAASLHEVLQTFPNQPYIEGEYRLNILLKYIFDHPFIPVGIVLGIERNLKRRAVEQGVLTTEAVEMGIKFFKEWLKTLAPFDPNGKMSAALFFKMTRGQVPLSSLQTLAEETLAFIIIYGYFVSFDEVLQFLNQGGLETLLKQRRFPVAATDRFLILEVSEGLISYEEARDLLKQESYLLPLVQKAAERKKSLSTTPIDFFTLSEEANRMLATQLAREREGFHTENSRINQARVAMVGTYQLLARRHKLPEDLQKRLANKLLELLATVQWWNRDGVSRMENVSHIPHPYFEDAEMRQAFEKVVQAELKEAHGLEPNQRGGVLAKGLSVLVQAGHPLAHFFGIEILKDLLNPGTRERIHGFSKEVHALKSIHNFLVDSKEFKLDLDQIFSTEEGRSLLSRVRQLVGHITKTGQVGQSPGETQEFVDATETLFYGRPMPSSLEALDPAQRLGPAEHGTDPLLETLSQALVPVSEVQGLIRMESDPRTGLTVVTIGDQKFPIWRGSTPVQATARRAQTKAFEKEAGAIRHEAAMREISALVEEQRKLQESGALVLAKGTADLVAAGRLEEAGKLDLFALMRRSAGIDVEGGQDPIQRIVNRISIEQGLNMIAIAGYSNGAYLEDKESELTLEKLWRQFPNLTAVEIGLFSILNGVPHVAMDPKSLAMLFHVTKATTEWASDDYDAASGRRGLYPTDPYTHSGIVGKRDGTDTIPFNLSIQKEIEAILKLSLSDTVIFRRIWENTFEASARGLLMLKNSAPGPKVLINKKVKWLGSRVGGTEELSIHKIIKLVGLLESVPSPLLDPQPVLFYVKPFGLGVLFLDGEGKVKAYIPYHPHIQREGFEDIHGISGGDESDWNLAAHEFFNQKLFPAIVAKTQGEAEEKAGHLSPLEEAMTDFWMRYQIHFSVMTEKMRDEEGDRHLGAFATEKSLKFGLDEIKEIERLFALLPPQLIGLARYTDPDSNFKGLTKIVKAPMPFAEDFVDFSMSSTFKLGEFDPLGGEVILYYLPKNPYRSFDPPQRQLFRATVLHEFAEALFQNLPEEVKKAIATVYPWRFVNKKRSYIERITPENTFDYGDSGCLQIDLPKEELPKHLLTSYSSSNPRDLFCEAFAMYILHGEEFRAKAEGSPYLARLYEILQRLFSVEFSIPPEVSLSQIEAEITQWKNEMNRRKLEETWIDEEEATKMAMGRVASSIDDWGEQEFKEDEASWTPEERAVEHFYDAVRTDEAGRSQRKVAEYIQELDPELKFEAKALEFIVDVLKEAYDWTSPVEEGEEENEERLKMEEDVSLEEEGLYGDDREDQEKWLDRHRDPKKVHEYERRSLAERASLPDYEKVGVAIDTSSPIGLAAHQVWDALRKGKPEKVVRILEKIGENVTPNTETDDIFHEIVDAVSHATSDEIESLDQISRDLKNFILPGHYTVEDLMAIRKIKRDSKLSSFEMLAKLNEWLIQKRWPWSDEKRVQFLARFLEKREPVNFREKPISVEATLPKIFLLLEKKNQTVDTIAEEVGMEIGWVDGVASVYLSPENYRRFTLRTERTRLKNEIAMMLKVRGFVREKSVELEGEVKRLEALRQRLREEKTFEAIEEIQREMLTMKPVEELIPLIQSFQ